MTMGAVVHAVVDQEASPPQFKKTEETTRGKKIKKNKKVNEAKKDEGKF